MLPKRTLRSTVTRKAPSGLQLYCDEYAKLEKELLAIVYACEKFDQDIFDRSNVIVTAVMSQP